jgi:hypothetical protein
MHDTLPSRKFPTFEEARERGEGKRKTANEKGGKRRGEEKNFRASVDFPSSSFFPIRPASFFHPLSFKSLLPGATCAARSKLSLPIVGYVGK